MALHRSQVSFQVFEQAEKRLAEMPTTPQRSEERRRGRRCVVNGATRADHQPEKAQLFFFCNMGIGQRA